MKWRHRIGHWMRSTVAPVLWPKGAETCPKCRRPIPGAIAPRALFGMGVPVRWGLPTAAELVRLCPIDGPLGRRHTPHPRSIAELRASGSHVRQVLRSQHDASWAKLFDRALSSSDDKFLTLVGHSLAVLVRRGPLRDSELAKDDVEQLLVDTVALWPARPATGG